MKVPRLGVDSELQLPAYTTATVMQDLSRICDLCRSLGQCQVLNPLTKARDPIQEARERGRTWGQNEVKEKERRREGMRESQRKS